uniref:Glycoprotein endo-alpha-1,2-mannosidase n=1 Tax=Parastrongyloides trichosuri TaxID=131310 RepID=A0A0N4ZH07_PARTI
MRGLQMFKVLIGCAMVTALYLGFAAVMNTNNKQYLNIRQEKNFILKENKPIDDISDNIIDTKEKVIDSEIVIPNQDGDNKEKSFDKPLPTPKIFINKIKPTTTPSIINNEPKDVAIKKEPLQMTTKNVNVTRVVNEKDHTSAPIHIFYYPWYGAPKFDNGTYKHWNHKVLKKWDDPSTAPTYVYKPPNEISSVFYPQLGPYSSRDPEVIDKHMKMMSAAGIDVAAVSWLPKDFLDNEGGKSWDDFTILLLDAAKKYKLKIAFHMEPYEGRTAESVANDIKYIIDTYGEHPAFYKMKPKKVEVKKGSLFEKDAKDIAQLERPVFYLYDSYLIDSSNWIHIASLNGSSTIRHTRYDSILIGLLVNENDKMEIVNAGFDGFYTYFASEGFSYGSTMNNWKQLSEFCEENDLLFVPSVGPGYNDERVRPWNKINTKPRNDGNYYKEHFKAAHTARADIVSITSFNEWHEGTQIEPAVPFIDSYTHPNEPYIYEKYSKDPEQYLHITLEMIKQYFTPHSDNIEAKLGAIV